LNTVLIAQSSFLPEKFWEFQLLNNDSLQQEDYMNFRLVSSSLLLAVSAFLPFAPSLTSSASAQCAMVDVSVQTAIRGSKTPATQNNNVDMQSSGSCVGNTIVHTNTQTAVSPGNVTQNRTSSEQIIGGADNGTGVYGSTIKVPVEVKTDVYSPGLDSDFLSHVGTQSPR